MGNTYLSNKQKYFAKSLQFGEIGEMQTWNYLSRSPNVKEIIDVRDDERSQNTDVDFLVKDTKNQVYYVEVKTDYVAHKTRNIAYETQTSGNVGCFSKTKADFVFYYIVPSNELLQINVKMLRNHISNNNYNEVNMGDNAKGYLINIEDLENKKILYKRMKGTY